MIYEHTILRFLAEKFKDTDTFNALGLTQAAVVTKINPIPVGEPVKVMPCITLMAGDPNSFEPADEGAQEATYNVRVTYYRPIYAGDNISDVMSRELAQIADEFKAWGNLSQLLLPNASPEVMYFNGNFETLEGWFEKEKLDDNNEWTLAVFGYFNLQIKITNLL
jgi:hypothetical protein